MDAVITLGDQTVDVFDADLSGVREFEGTPRNKATGRHAKDYRFEDWLVLRVKRTIDENASAGGRWHSDLAVSNHQLDRCARAGVNLFLVLTGMSSFQFC